MSYHSLPLNLSRDQLISLLRDLELYPLLIRRFLERSNSSSFKPSPEEQVAFQKAFLVREQIRDQGDLLSWLDGHGISETQLSQRLFHALQLEQFKQSKFGSQVEQIFLQRKTSLDRVIYSLLRVRRREKIAELNRRLEEGEASFADLASTYSEGSERQINGLIGPMELGQINPVLAERLRISKPGQLWPPFEAEGWWVLLRHERHLPAQLDQAMQQRLLNEIYELWMREQVSAALTELELANPAQPRPETDQAPTPSTELPARDTLQPNPDQKSSAPQKPNRLKSLFSLG